MIQEQQNNRISAIQPEPGVKLRGMKQTVCFYWHALIKATQITLLHLVQYLVGHGLTIS